MKQIDAEMEKPLLIANLETANLFKNNPTAMKLKYMQTLKTITDEGKTTICFPLPI